MKPVTASPLRILYLAAGGPGSTSLMRANALSRLGHNVTTIPMQDCIGTSPWLQRLHHHTGYQLIERFAARFLASRIGASFFDIAWVDSGYLVGPSCMAVLRACAQRLVNYNSDDPTGPRDGNRWGSYLKVLSQYDLIATVRRSTEQELKRMGARSVCRVWMCYDEIMHKPRVLSAADRKHWSSDVIFVGSWMPERGPFLHRLLELGVPLTIIGDRWEKAAEFAVLRRAWRGPSVLGDDYAKAIQCSRLALGLLSKGNRDLHTTRSTEIPALGGVLCAERTTEHLELFREWEEAVFWKDADECAEICMSLLADESRRASIAKRGHARVCNGDFSNEKVLSLILRQL